MTTFSAGKSRLWPTAIVVWLRVGRQRVDGVGSRRRLGGVGIRPGVVVPVEGAIRLPDGEDQMEQLAHAVAQGHVATFAPGPRR